MPSKPWEMCRSYFHPTLPCKSKGAVATSRNVRSFLLSVSISICCRGTGRSAQNAITTAEPVEDTNKKMLRAEGGCILLENKEGNMKIERRLIWERGQLKSLRSSTAAAVEIYI